MHSDHAQTSFSIVYVSTSTHICKTHEEVHSLKEHALQASPALRLGVSLENLPLLHPLCVYEALRDEFGAERAFLLESLAGPEVDNRFSLCGLAGRAEIVVRDGAIKISGEAEMVRFFENTLRDAQVLTGSADELRLASEDALWRLPRVIESAIRIDDANQGLALSFLSFFGYDAARYIEELPYSIQVEETTPPDAVFSLVDALVTFGKASTELALVSSTLWASVDRARILAAVERSVELDVGDDIAPQIPEPTAVVDDITESEYLAKGQVCLEHIRLGDIYQVQLGHSITISTEAEPLAVYRRLRVRNPSPYMALLTMAGHTVVCASPELFVRLEGRTATMRPIAGTAPRGGDEQVVQASLLADPKERAEHLKLVDLCRNDLGRVSVPGTLEVGTLMAIEAYSHVFHIVSQVECELSGDLDIYDVIRAGFPAGTMSGAPKVRAMEIIESLETSRRGFYAGAFGLLGMHGRESVTGLAIRMAVHKDNRFVIRASAGFVADSTPSGEWDETLNKLAATYWAVTGKEIR